MSRALAKVIPRILNEWPGSSLQRTFGPSMGSSWLHPTDYFDREFRNLESMMNRMANDMWRSFEQDFPTTGMARSQDPTRNLYRIVEEDGKRKVRVQFDAENIQPENIEVKTMGNHVEIRAKQEEKSNYHTLYQEYSRRIGLPEGVNPQEMTCRFEDGVVTLEAPYNPPAVESGGNPKQINVQHEGEPAKAAPQEIPIKHQQSQ